MTETELIDRARRGDPAAERALYDANVDRVFRLAYRMTGESHLAEDLVQDTFVRAFDRLGDFRGEAAFSTWLHSVAVSVILNAMRKVKRIRSRERDLEAAAHVGSPPSGTEPDVADRIAEAMDELSEDYRIVVAMHDLEGYTHEEIGAALGVATGTSKARLSRARARLRESLADYAGEWMA